MKWPYSISNKFTAALLLTVTFVVIVVKNIKDEKNVSLLGNSFSAVYEDRLLAESYIYGLADHLYQKRLLIDNCEQHNGTVKSEIDHHNVAINNLVADYEKTNLTEAESLFFQGLKRNMEQMRTLELQYVKHAGNDDERDQTRMQLDHTFILASQNLNRLSNIQITEGRLLNEHSKKIIAGSTMLTQLELAILIAIGLIIQVLIFASKSALSKTGGKHSLN